MTNREKMGRMQNLLRRERANLLGALEGLTDEQLNFKPNSRSWSAGQVAQHVGIGEEVWQGFLRSLLSEGAGRGGKVRRISLQELSFTSRLIPDFVLNSPLVLEPVSVLVDWMPRPLQMMFFAVPLVKIGAGPRMQPAGGLSGKALLEYLSGIRKATLELLGPHSDEDLSTYRIIHPLIGDRNIYSVLEMLANHERRHTSQIKSVIGSAGFPA